MTQMGTPSPSPIFVLVTVSKEQRYLVYMWRTVRRKDRKKKGGIVKTPFPFQGRPRGHAPLAFVQSPHFTKNGVDGLIGLASSVSNLHLLLTALFPVFNT